MNRTVFQKKYQIIVYGIVIAILLTSCGAAPVPTTPIVVPPNLVSGNTTANTYVNVLINSVEFTGAVSNSGSQGNLQLFTVVSDDAGHSDALVCPYGSLMQIHQGDKVNPCQAGLSYPENLLKDHLYVMLIAVDVKDKSDLTDLGSNGLSSALGFGLEQVIRTAAPAAVASLGPWAIVGFLGLDAVLGFAGNKAQDYFQKNYVIGTQSFVISRQYNWNNDEAIVAQSTNNQVKFTFTTQKSSTAEGIIVQASSANPPAPLAQSTSVPAVAAAQPRIFNFQACVDPCTGSNSITSFPEKITKIYLQWQYENIPANASYVRFTSYGGTDWARYVCIWPNSSNGTDSVTFTEPGGIQSGEWMFTIMINGATLLQQTFNVQGSFKYWSPAGLFNTCTGKR